MYFLCEIRILDILFEDSQQPPGIHGSNCGIQGSNVTDVFRLSDASRRTKFRLWRTAQNTEDSPTPDLFQLFL